MAACVNGTCNVSWKIVLCSSSKKCTKSVCKYLTKPSESDERMWHSYEEEKSDETNPAFRENGTEKFWYCTAEEMKENV